MTFPMTALSPSATKVIIDEEEVEDEATPLKSFKEIEEEKEAEKKREQRFVITLPSPCFRCFSKNLYTLSSLLWGLIFRRILIVIFLLHYLQLRLLSLSGPLDQQDALMLILDQIPETVSQNTHLYLLTKYMYLLIPVQLYRKSTYYIP